MFDHVGHGESFFENGVDDELVVSGPWSTEAEQLVVLRLFVGVEEFVEVVSDFSFSEGLAEEDELEVLVEVEFDVGVAFLDVSDFSDEFFDQEGEGKFVSDWSWVFSWDEDGHIDFLFNNFLLLDLVESGELDELVKFSEEGFNDFDLNFESRSLGLEFSEFGEDSLEVSSDCSIELFVSDLWGTDVNSDSDT